MLMAGRQAGGANWRGSAMQPAGLEQVARPDGLFVLFAVLLYVGLLLLLARMAKGDQLAPGRNLWRGVGYGLSLSVLCTSWTFFGAVGLAVRGSWDFLPNALGPILALTILFPVWQRIARAARRDNVNSVADFIASRYGKNRRLGALIAGVSIVGALPYMALQLTALTKATGIVIGSPAPELTAPLILIALAMLAIMVGARRPSLTQHNRGLTRVVTMESVVKIATLVAVALLAISVLRQGEGGLTLGTLAQPPRIGPGFLLATFLCTVTMFSLPRVFHIGFVTLTDISDIKVGRWLFPLYMLLWAAAIVPIAVLGQSLAVADGDMVVLLLPMTFGNPAILTLALLGGFSAGAAMVMVEVIALSAMVANELVIPWMTRWQIAIPQGRSIGEFIVLLRRLAIIAILGLAYVYFRVMPADTDLARLGFTSLAASAQIVPALIGSVVWQRGQARAAFWSIVVGMLIWGWGVVLPQLGGPGLPLSWAAMPDPFDLAVLVSLLANLAIYVGASLLQEPAGRPAPERPAAAPLQREQPVSVLDLGDLRRLLRQVLGAPMPVQGMADFAREDGSRLTDAEPVTPMMARLAERMLAGAIGASSARNVIDLAVARQPERGDVDSMLDQAANAVQFSREIVYAALNGIEDGVVVVDDDLCLLAWNARFLELFGHPAGEVQVGQGIAALISAGQGAGHSAGAPQALAMMMEARLDAMRQREPQIFEARGSDGRILRVVGRPLASGVYVTIISDVSEVRAAETRMRSITEELEQRVSERTAALTAANAALAEANALAERVVSAQNRFVAAASHDLAQPLHAARLYLATAAGEARPESRLHDIIGRADLSIQAADRLLNALLSLSRIEIGGEVPDVRPVALHDLLITLRDEFTPLAEAKGLELHTVCAPQWIASNPDLLRSVLQNLIGNAVRYTAAGRILLCVRPESGRLRIEVRDSGPGIAEEAQELIFREFTRLDRSRATSAGSGLGLAIAWRICRALDHRLALRSAPGRGSVFSVLVPLAMRPQPASGAPMAGPALHGLKILCVDDQPDVRQAQTMLLQRWGADVTEAASAGAALDVDGPFDVVLADLNLGGDMDGAALIGALQPSAGICVLVTSDVTEKARRLAEGLGVSLLRKPLGAGALRAVLMEAARLRTARLDPIAL